MSPSPTPSRGPSGKLREWLGHDAHPLVQFIKYGFSGGMAAVTYLGTIAVLTNTLFPVKDVDAATRGWHYLFALSAAFVTSNTVGYLLNVAFVFKPGRHGKRKEILLFLGLSGIAWVLTAPAGSWAMSHYPGLSKWVPTFITAFVSAMINYTGRKFFIFLK